MMKTGLNNRSSEKGQNSLQYYANENRIDFNDGGTIAGTTCGKSQKRTCGKSQKRNAFQNQGKEAKDHGVSW